LVLVSTHSGLGLDYNTIPCYYRCAIT